MKSVKTLLLLCALAASTSFSQAQVILGVDFNDRSQDPAPLTFGGFQSFMMESNISTTAIQTNATVRTFGAYTVTLNGFGANPGYDDRLRGTPINSGAFSQSLLLRDVIFSPGDGLDVAVDGLNPFEEYRVTVWSFDSGSTGGGVRHSDWAYNGTVVTNGYAFTGATAPVNDEHYQFSFNTLADENGRILIQGRRNSLTSSSQIAVFLNAIQIASPLPVPPTIHQHPVAASGFAGDNAILTVAASGTGPLRYQWYKDGSPIDDATNAVLYLLNLQAGDEADYAAVVSNDLGDDTSTPVHVTVLPVESVFTGLVSYWPMDVLGDMTPDVTASQNHLFQYGMDSSFLVSGSISNAVNFSNPTGVTNYLVRSYTGTTNLPIYSFPSYTVAFWVKGPGNQSDRRVYAEGATNTTTPLFTIGTHNGGSNGAVNVYIRNDGNGVLVNHAKSSLIAFDDTWHHVAWVDNNGFGSIYVDGVKDATNIVYGRGGLTLNVSSVGTVYRTNGAVASFTGSVDDLAMWKRSLSASEIQFVMLNSLPIPELVDISSEEGSITLTYKTPVEANPIVQQLSEIGGIWTPVDDVTFTPYEGGTFRAQFVVPAGSQRFYRLVY